MIFPVTRFTLTQTLQVSELDRPPSLYQLLSITGQRVTYRRMEPEVGKPMEQEQIFESARKAAMVKAFLKSNQADPFAQGFSTPAGH